MTRRAVALLLAWAALMAAGIATATATAWEHEPTIATTPPTAAAPPCDWQAEWDGTLAELGETGDDWYTARGDTMRDIGGITYLDTRRVIVHADAPCRLLGDIIRHEWMHLQQARSHGGRGAVDYYGDRLEIVADCGSWLLGSVSYTPYRDEHGCTPRDLADARALIQAAGNGPAT